MLRDRELPRRALARELFFDLLFPALPFATLPLARDADFFALGLAPASIEARESVRTRATNNERVLSLRSDPDIPYYRPICDLSVPMRILPTTLQLRWDSATLWRVQPRKPT
jgi:hypothetical protein